MKNVVLAAGYIAMVVVVGVGIVQYRQNASSTVVAASATVVATEFPTIDTAQLSTAQRRVLTTLQEEYAKSPQSYDAAVLEYTEGFEEAWCADFISWVMNQAETPFVHPDTGYWRIPGVRTLTDYYEQYDAYYEVGEYTPVLGDVAFYEGETPDGGSSEHVAMVLKVEGNMITTIGGNEGDDEVVQIRTDELREGVKGLVGFGSSQL